LADELLECRVEQWPLLRLVYWPFGWLSRVVGRRVGAATARGLYGSQIGARTIPSRAPDTSDPFDSCGSSLVDRIKLMRSRIMADNAAVTRRFDLESELPGAEGLAARVTTAAKRVVPLLEARLLDDIRALDRKPSMIGKTALWLIFLWFPFLQPLLAGGLEMFANGGTVRLAHGLYTIVSALSAAHLLAGFAVVAGVYVALIAGMYARALRAVGRARGQQDGWSPMTQAVDEILITQVLAPLTEPFRERLERLTALQSRLAG
jgi:hypothetical protein